MTWAAVATGASALISGGIQASSAKKAGKAGKKSAKQQIEFARESRDIELARTEPYVQAGHSALRALMSLTGLGGGGPAGGPSAAPVSDVQDVAPVQQTIPNRPMISRRGSMFQQRAGGGPISQDTYYDVNEEGPENRYVGGRVIRNPRPMTIDGETGYVEPNIEGRFLGGAILKNNPITKRYSPLAKQLQGGQRKRSRRLSALEEQMSNLGSVSQPESGFANTPNADTTAINPETGYPYENPGGVEGGYNFQTDPGYQFRYAEGMRALERSAAARGGLLSGGFARKAIRYGQDFASNEFANVYNRIANIAGVGQTANSQANQSSQFATGAINQGTSDAGYARASGYLGQGNAYANTVSELGQIDWGNIFNRNKNVSPGPRS